MLRARNIAMEKAMVRGVRQAGITKEWVIDMLKENVDRAMQARPVLDKDGNETGRYEWNGFVANKALELLGREIGMFVERHELTLAQRLSEMPEDQRAAEMLELVERARARLQQIRAAEQRTIEGSTTEVSVSGAEPPD